MILHKHCTFPKILVERGLKHSPPPAPDAKVPRRKGRGRPDALVGASGAPTHRSGLRASGTYGGTMHILILIEAS